MELDRDAEQLLLGRPVESVLTAFDRRALKGRRLLVTGAGGSVGSELARQLASCAPASLTLVDHAEYNLFRVEHRLRDRVSAARGSRRARRRQPSRGHPPRCRGRAAARRVSRRGLQARDDGGALGRRRGADQRARHGGDRSRRPGKWAPASCSCRRTRRPSRAA